MTRIVYAVAAALLGCWTSQARAESLPYFADVPTTYTPGVPFSFDVRVPLLTDFTSFSAQLVFTTDMQDPPLSVATAAPSFGRYVFPSSANLHSESSAPAGFNEVNLFISGSTTPGVLTNPGTNDTLSRVTVQPGRDLAGPITISLGSDTLFRWSMESRYRDADAVTVEQAVDDNGNPVTSPVPAPAGVALLGFGGLLLGVRQRLARQLPAGSGDEFEGKAN